MGRVRPRLAPEVAARIPAQAVGRWRLVLGAKALVAGPGIEQGPIDGEMLVGEQSPCLSGPEHFVEQGVAMFEEAERLGAEGIIGKRAASSRILRPRGTKA